jgi:hypothetical protein
MYRDFHPDVILGCNVSSIPADPKENNLMSQLEAMIVSQKEAFIPCEEVFIVHPNSSNTTTFEFANSMAAIDSGYVSTLRSLPEIKRIIEREISAEDLKNKRSQFRLSSDRIATCLKAAERGAGAVLIPEIFGTYLKTLSPLDVKGWTDPYLKIFLAAPRVARSLPRVTVTWDWIISLFKEGSVELVEPKKDPTRLISGIELV